MRFVRSVQFVVGFAAVSGAFMLSGSALAADGSSVTNTQNNSSSTSRQIDQNNPTITSDTSGPTSTGGTDVSETGNTVAQNSNTSTPNSSVTSNVTSDETLPAVPTIVDQDPTNGSQTTTTSTTTSTTTTGIVSGQTTDDMNPPATTAPVVTSPQQAEHTADTTAAPSVPVIVYRSEILEVQPTMMSGGGPTGMAPSVSTQPAPAKAPVPPKPDGFLASLTEMLAATVVPAPFFTGLSTVYLPGLALSLITLVVLLGSLVIATYGQWLRRSGYVTAARSDAPASFIALMIFATPYRLGYAPASPQMHSPSLLVSDYKIRTNEFPTL